MAIGACCNQMRRSLEFECANHDSPFDCPDQLIWQGNDGRHGLIVRDGGSSYVSIFFCPWCGSDLRERSQGGI